MNHRITRRFLLAAAVAICGALVGTAGAAAIPIPESVRPFEVRGTLTITAPGYEATKSIVALGQYDFDEGIVLRVTSEGRATTRVPMLLPDGGIDLSGFQSVQTVEGAPGFTLPPQTLRSLEVESQEAVMADFHEVLPRSLFLHDGDHTWQQIDANGLIAWSQEPDDAIPFPLLEVLRLAGTPGVQWTRTDEEVQGQFPGGSFALDSTGSLLLRFERRSEQGEVIRFQKTEASLVDRHTRETLLRGLPTELMEERGETQIFLQTN